METQERVWLTLEKLLQAASGDQPYPEAIAEIRLLVAWLYQSFGRFATKEDAMALLSEIDEPSQEHLQMLEAISAHVIPLAYKFMRRIAEESLKNIPAPPGGRPVHSTTEERQALCQEILALIGSGLSPAEAKRRVARRAAIGEKTMDRIWTSRSKSPAASFTMQDAQKMFRAFFE